VCLLFTSQYLLNKTLVKVLHKSYHCPCFSLCIMFIFLCSSSSYIFLYRTCTYTSCIDLFILLYYYYFFFRLFSSVIHYCWSLSVSCVCVNCYCTSNALILPLLACSLHVDCLLLCSVKVDHCNLNITDLDEIMNYNGYTVCCFSQGCSGY